MPSDKEYKETRQIMLGKANMNPDFTELAEFIDKTFSVKPINIIYDTFEKEKRPRLNICFEFEQEKASFNEGNGHINFDRLKQRVIADKFTEICNKQKLTNGKELFNFLNRFKSQKYKSDNIWIYYSAFEPIARIEANEKIPQYQIVQLKKELNNNDIWDISRGFSGVTFFVYTDQQVKKYENSSERKLWVDKYFDLLEPYNEFNYFKRDIFNIYIDSKENFDNNYQSNWYYYYK